MINDIAGPVVTEIGHIQLTSLREALTVAFKLTITTVCVALALATRESGSASRSRRNGALAMGDQGTVMFVTERGNVRVMTSDVTALVGIAIHAKAAQVTHQAIATRKCSIAVGSSNSNRDKQR